MTSKKCNTCKTLRPLSDYDPGRAICNICRQDRKNVVRRDTRLETRITKFLPHLVEWCSIKDAAFHFDLTLAGVGVTLRKLQQDGLVQVREIKGSLGGKPIKQYKRTAKGDIELEALVPSPIHRHPWETLGLDWRPDWKTDKRYIPAPESNKFYQI